MCDGRLPKLTELLVKICFKSLYVCVDFVNLVQAYLLSSINQMLDIFFNFIFAYKCTLELS